MLLITNQFYHIDVIYKDYNSKANRKLWLKKQILKVKEAVCVKSTYIHTQMNQSHNKILTVAVIP